MPRSLSNAIAKEVRKRISVFSTAAWVTARPTAFTDAVSHDDRNGHLPPFRFFLACVGIVLAIEAAFSYLFDTAFSDLVHHFFPVLVALTGGVGVYLFLKLLFTRNLAFRTTLESALYVGGTALAVMIAAVFLLLTADFAINYASVMASGCKTRTIMCLLSGNTQMDYGLMQDVATPETQGGSFGSILLIIFAAAIYYTHVLSTVLKRKMDVARWRTYMASFVSVLVLSPAYLFLLNAIYRTIYGVN